MSSPSQEYHQQAMALLSHGLTEVERATTDLLDAHGEDGALNILARLAEIQREARNVGRYFGVSIA